MPVFLELRAPSRRPSLYMNSAINAVLPLGSSFASAVGAVLSGRVARRQPSPDHFGRGHFSTSLPATPPPVALLFPSLHAVRAAGRKRYFMLVFMSRRTMFAAIRPSPIIRFAWLLVLSYVFFLRERPHFASTGNLAAGVSKRLRSSHCGILLNLVSRLMEPFGRF